MNKKTLRFPGIDTILTGFPNLSKHILFLYISHTNKYAFQSSFFAMSDNDEELLYVTGELPEQVMSMFAENTNLKIICPKNIDDLRNKSGRLRIILDMSSIGEGHENPADPSKIDEDLRIHQILEELLTENKDSIALCMHDLSLLAPERVQELAASHDRLILNAPDITTLSGEKLDIADAAVERFVKEYLDVVVLALVAGKPMCGTDILEIIHRYFNVLLSPGTLYPLLHRLKKEGLLECEYNTKKKVYKQAKGSEDNIRRILDEHSLANEFLNDFLKSRILEANKNE